MGNWKSLKWNELSEVPMLAGVYAIYEGKTLIYIGQSRFLRERLIQHAGQLRAKKIGIPNKGVIPQQTVSEDLWLKYKTCKRKGEWLMLEYRLINRLKPKANWTTTLAGRRSRMTLEVLGKGWIAAPPSRKWSPATRKKHEKFRAFKAALRNTIGSPEDRLREAHRIVSQEGTTL